MAQSQRMSKEERLYYKPFLADYLRSQGITVNSGKTSQLRCFLDGHEDKNPSMTYFPDSYRVHCFACNWGGDIFDVIGKIEGLNKRQQEERVRQLYGEFSSLSANQLSAPRAPVVPVVPVAKPLESVGTLERRAKTIERVKGLTDPDPDGYFKKRGIAADVLRRFSVGVLKDYVYPSKNGKGLPQTVAIFPNEGGLNARILNPRGSTRYLKEGTSGLFNAGVLEQTDPVFVVEGEIDALSIESVGYHAVALGGAGNHAPLLNKVKDGKVFASLIIALDKDPTGDKESKKLSQGLTALGFAHYVEPQDKLWNSCTDANELLVNGEKDGDYEIPGKDSLKYYLENAIFRAENNTLNDQSDYRKSRCIANYASSFLEQISTVQPDPVKTGFEHLDPILGGGLYPRLYVIGAITSAGKTAFTMQVADNIARQGRDVLVFALEMGRSELIARSVSRLTYEMGLADYTGDTYASTANNVQYKFENNRTPEQEQRIYDASRQYIEECGQHMFIEHGVGRFSVADIEKHVKQHKAQCGVAPVVVVDYLQILAATDPRATEKQAADYAILTLKRLSAVEDTPVIVVSSLNRQAGTGAVQLNSFKESGGIEYSADVCLGLSFHGCELPDDINKKRREPVRKLDLTVLKNRAGTCGATVTLEHHARFNYFKSIESDV